jgi:Rap1a immunity proteins
MVSTPARFAFALAIVLAPWPWVAFTADANGLVDGNKLMRWCEDKPDDSFLRGLCLGYVEATADALMAERPGRQCISRDVTFGQLEEVVRKYLREHPENRGYGANVIVASALTEAFPCTGQR